MKPEARHVQLNVDVKLDNDPEVLFELMNREIMKFEDWESELAPRLILGEFSLLRLLYLCSNIQRIYRTLLNIPCALLLPWT
jgi:hypothetical protein